MLRLLRISRYFHEMCQTHLDRLDVVLEEEAVGHSRYPKVVDVLPPGPSLAHLCAGDPVRGDDLGEARARGKKTHVNRAAEVNELETDRVGGEHLLCRHGSGRQTGDALGSKKIQLY